MDSEQRVGEVIEACTTDFTAQCYELYQTPPLGSLVKTRFEAQNAVSQDSWLYGIVYKAQTGQVIQAGVLYPGAKMKRTRMRYTALARNY